MDSVHKNPSGSVTNGKCTGIQMSAQVAVVVVNWNGWRDTIQCLRSLHEALYRPLEVIVVDNDSGDDSVAHIHASFPDIDILEPGANLGFGGGNNAGIRRAIEHGADYVWLLNNDAKADPGALSALVRAAEADPRLGAVGSVLYRLDRLSEVQVWGGGRLNLWTGTSRHCLTAAGAEHLDYIVGASMLLRVQAVRETGLFDDRVFFMSWEDSDLCCRLRRKGWRLGVARDSVVWHKESASYGPHTEVLDTHFNTSAARFFRRYAPLPVVPITIGAGGRFLKRALRGDWKRARAVFRGTLAGVRSHLPAPPAGIDE